MKIKCLLFVILFVCVPIEQLTIDDEQSNTFQKPNLDLKTASKIHMDENPTSSSLHISEELQYEQSQELDIRTYWIPAVGDTYQGTIRTRDVQINSIVNGDAETTSLERWTTLEYPGGEVDTGTPHRFASDNPWSYTPQSGNSFYLFDVDSTQLVWIADYFADTTLPSRTTSLSFSFDNAWNSGFSTQSNVDLHITFDFDGFDVIFFLYTKYPGSSFPYNTTVGGNHFVHYLINSSWGSGWQDIGQIDLSTALIELGMYTESSLPSYFMFNEMRVEALAYDPFKLHLLIDNLSVKSELDADSAGLTVNTIDFTNEVCTVNDYVQNEKNEGVIGFEIQSKRYDENKIELYGNLIFDIRFILDNLNYSEEYYFVNGNYIGWLVKFNVYKPQDDSFQIYNIHINTPVEWNAISLIDSDGNDQMKQIDIEERIKSIVLTLNRPYLKAGQFSFKAYGPNYITEIIAPHTTNHSLQLPLKIKTLQVLGADMLIQVEKLPNNEAIASKTIFQVNSSLYSTIIEFNETITSGQYRLTAQMQSDLRVGIRFHDFNVTTDMAVIQILSENTVDIFEDYIFSVQCLDIPNASKIENAYVIYSWELGNGTLSYDEINHNYWTNIKTYYSDGNYSLVV
ncbi:MAG: hypothetical protein ACXAD7_28680, partial [Candidatus Kariarchaeaceae archaeon]